jgi:DNA repair protein RecN (Recombination protein N)
LITNLSIKNFALIDDIQVDFKAGFTIMTGETGAGKSIVLDALSLLLGKRADLNSIKDKSRKCVIEGEFFMKEEYLKDLFNSIEIDFDVHTIIRRELLPSGKSRAFVNDTVVNLNQLQELAPYLVDIHGQHETLELFSETFQLEVIDVLANNGSLLTEYKRLLKRHKESSETLAELKYKKETFTKELDYNTFLYKELEEAGLDGVNLEELEEELDLLNNIETVQESVSQALSLLSQEQYGSIDNLKEIRQILNRIRSINNEYSDYWERMNSLVIELEDLQDGLYGSAERIEADPERLQQLNDQLQLIHSLQKKHTVATVQELIDVRNSLEAKINQTLHLDSSILTLEKECFEREKKLRSYSEELHKKRVKVVPVLVNKLSVYLNDLGLANAQFKFNFQTTGHFKENGTDQLTVLFTANKGISFGPLKKIASGGELNRIMLAIKAVLAQYKQLPTLIFDEIDSGISGSIALKMAAILSEMGRSMQMICITHQAQIAAKGSTHIKVFKEDINDRTVTLLRTLDAEERLGEIAEMLGGKDRSESVLLHARELLN